MNIFPKIKKCPSCGTFNVIKINGIVYENSFESLVNWTLKKIFNCRKCKIELGLFLNNYDKNNYDKKEKLVWLDYFKCEDNFYNTLVKLQSSKSKYKKFNKKYNQTLEEIKNIQNEIRQNQIKIKIKYKIENRRLTGHLY